MAIFNSYLKLPDPYTIKYHPPDIRDNPDSLYWNHRSQHRRIPEKLGAKSFGGSNSDGSEAKHGWQNHSTDPAADLNLELILQIRRPPILVTHGAGI